MNNSFSCFCRCQSGISHILINSHDGKFDVGTGTQFKDLKDLILFYKEHQQLRDVKNQAMIKLEEVKIHK